MTLGTSPIGSNTKNESEISGNIRQMFGKIAPHYDFLNRFLSLCIDQYWRRTLVRQARTEIKKSRAYVLDLCCGTGDLLIELEREHRHMHGGTEFMHVGVDFSRPMLNKAAVKLKQQELRTMLTEADVLQLPLSEAQFDLVTVAFGFRNLANYQKGLDEMFRILRPGGRLALLEFSQPKNPLSKFFFSFYFRNIMPFLGNTISGSENAYSYLQQSVGRFLTPSELDTKLKAAGFSNVENNPLTGGVAVIHLATKCSKEP